MAELLPNALCAKGALTRLRPDDLAAQVVRRVVERAGLFSVS